MWNIAILLGLLIGGAVGAVVAFLWAERRSRHAAADAATKLALSEQRAADLTQQYAAATVTIDSLRRELAAVSSDRAVLSTQLTATQDNLASQTRLLNEAQTKLTEAFAAVSSDALAKNNEAFLQLAEQKFAALTVQADGSLEQRKAQIEGLLKPLNEMLGQYQSRLAEIEKSRQESYGQLRQQIGSLTEAQNTLNQQTSQLVNALRKPGARGRWGELTLRRLVELSGLADHVDFDEQTSVATEDGSQRPDMVVTLPSMRQVVIDCKTSLDGFLDATACNDESKRAACLQRHAQQVRSRAKELASKTYWNQFSQSPEFVVMFLPGEAFLYAAVECDPALIEDCLCNKVIVATPTTLIALLKAVAYGWRQERIAENGEQIRKLGEQLFERIGVLAQHFASLGTSLEQAVARYNSTLGSMESRVMVTARKLAELGAKNGHDQEELLPVDTRPRELPASLAATFIS
jgi:DNA recombination protein RmuC